MAFEVFQPGEQAQELAEALLQQRSREQLEQRLKSTEDGPLSGSKGLFSSHFITISLDFRRRCFVYVS